MCICECVQYLQMSRLVIPTTSTTGEAGAPGHTDHTPRHTVSTVNGATPVTSVRCVGVVGPPCRRVWLWVGRQEWQSRATSWSPRQLH